MTRAEEYRHLANKVRARAFEEESPILKANGKHWLRATFGLQSKRMKLSNSTPMTRY
jgi:hypothetical protein